METAARRSDGSHNLWRETRGVCVLGKRTPLSRSTDAVNGELSISISFAPPPVVVVVHIRRPAENVCRPGMESVFKTGASLCAVA